MPPGDTAPSDLWTQFRRAVADGLRAKGPHPSASGAAGAVVGEGTERREFVPSPLPARAAAPGKPGPAADAAARGAEAEPAPKPVDDEVSSLFAELEGAGQKLGDDTRRLVRARPQARDAEKVVSVLVRTLVNKRDVSERDLDVVLEITKTRIVEMVRAQAVAISFVEENGVHIRSVSFGKDLTGRSRAAEKRYAELAAKMRGMVLPLDAGIVGRVLSDGRSRTTLDAATSPEGDHGRFEGLMEITVHAMLAVPILYEGATYGVIQAFNKARDSGEEFFSKRDVELVEEVAAYSAKVIYMARNPRHQWSGEDIARYVARLARADYIELAPGDVDRATLELVGEKIVRQSGIIPLRKLSVTKLRAAVDDPLDVQRRDLFTRATGLEVAEVAVASRDRIAAALDALLPGSAGGAISGAGAGPGAISGPVVIAPRAAAVERPAAPQAAAAAAPQLASLGEAFMNELEKRQREAEIAREKKGLEGFGESGDSAPVIQLVNRLIEEAYARGASDIHVDPFEAEVVVRFRVDGVLEEKLRMPSTAARAMASRLKIMSGLNISETRLPQDGRIRFKEFTRSGLDFDLRVATSPMAFGEKVVCRILDKRATSLGLGAMGFGAANLERYRTCLAAPHGMILHTGPTGSGKTTTLYAALAELNTPDMNIMTAEDPVEYMIPGINQLQIRPAIGLTFARALRAYLRQDPDIILVGEIRDLETAEIAIEAALTGHQLFSTLHTNDAAGTVMRFVEMGVEPFLVSSALLCVCAQRLLRKLCECKVAREPAAEERETCLSGAAPGASLSVFAARLGGCPRCSGSGFKGRIGTHELLVMDRALRDLVAKKGIAAVEIDRAARAHGMISLFDDAMSKVRDGITSLEEALRTVRVEKD